MTKYTMHLELEEVYTCEYEVEANNEDKAKEQIMEIDRQFGMNANETKIFDWDYYGTNLEISCENQEEN